MACVSKAVLLLQEVTGKRKVGRPIAYCGDPNNPELTPAQQRLMLRRTANRESARRARSRRNDEYKQLLHKVHVLLCAATANVVSGHCLFFKKVDSVTHHRKMFTGASGTAAYAARGLPPPQAADCSSLTGRRHCIRLQPMWGALHCRLRRWKAGNSELSQHIQAAQWQGQRVGAKVDSRQRIVLPRVKRTSNACFGVPQMLCQPESELS